MDLDDLIGQVEGDDPLDRLASAMEVKAELDELADALIGHFVEEARRAGRSWSEIGGAMGVSKQAAQQRHTNEPARPGGRGLFTRFAHDARQAVRAADDSARELGATYLGTEHLLLGVLADESNAGARVLAAVGVTRAHVVGAIEEIEQRFEPRYRRRRRPFTPRAKKVLELALREALTLGHNEVGTEHLVLGLLRETQGVASKAMSSKGVTRDALVAEINKVRNAA